MERWMGPCAVQCTILTVTMATIYDFSIGRFVRGYCLAQGATSDKVSTGRLRCADPEPTSERRGGKCRGPRLDGRRTRCEFQPAHAQDVATVCVTSPGHLPACMDAAAPAPVIS